MYKDIINNKDAHIYRDIKDDKHIVLHYLLNDRVVIEVFDRQGKQSIFKGEDKFYGVSKLNGRTQLDGTSEKNLNISSETTEALFKNLFKNYLQPKQDEREHKIEEYLSPVSYWQHNVDNNIADGLDELKRSIKEMQARGADLQYDRNSMLVVENDFLFSKNEQDWLNPETGGIELWFYLDIWRTDGKKFVEHWDIIQQGNKEQ